MVWEGTGMEPRRVQLRAELVGLEHIVFGSDYFVRSTRFMEWTIEFIDGLGLTASEREMIYEKNARQIPRSAGLIRSSWLDRKTSKP